MENIFEGAKFGDKFVTRDGRIAVYVEHNDFDDKYPHSILVDKTFEECMPNYDTLCFADNGEFDLRDNKHPLNIVSRYQKPIDEEKLEKEAAIKGQKYMHEEQVFYERGNNDYDDENGCCEMYDIDLSDLDIAYRIGYKAGYREALEYE